MNAKYDQKTVLEGNRLQNNRKETPSTFNDPNQLDRPKTRMAGEMGARALELMNNPMEQQRANQWMELFSESNEGSAFNQAKMMKAQTMAQVEARNGQN